MRIRYDVEKIKRIISDLCVLTGISMSFLDSERRTLCSYKRDGDFCSALQADKSNRGLCACSDEIILNKCLKSKRFESHVCHAGLLDAAMPIIKNGIIAGIVLMGRLRRSGDRSKTDSLSPTLAEKYVAVPEFNDSQIESLRSLLPNVLFESAIFLEYDGGFDEIVEYIKANLREPLGIDHICKKFHISKNSLYAHFKETYGKTVNEFIVDERMNMASQLLLNGSEPIYIVAESVGIDNHTYFCKIFKKRNGITPNQYRKSK